MPDDHPRQLADPGTLLHADVLDPELVRFYGIEKSVQLPKKADKMVRMKLNPKQHRGGTKFKINPSITPDNCSAAKRSQVSRGCVK